MKRTFYFLLSMLLAFTVACNSGNEKKAETPVAMEPLFQVALIKHTVANYDAWKSVYYAHDSVRQVYGISHYGLGRGMEDSNLVYVFNKLTDVQKAKDFSVQTDLKDAMSKAGVTSVPTFSYATVYRNDESKIDINARVMVSHKVKDFDAWLKVFDAEGSAARAENGLLDRGLARGIDDPNLVFIVFAIKDMEKAQARMNSDDLKKIMMDAGVEGPPQFDFYTLVE